MSEYFVHAAQDETMLSPANSDSWLNVDPKQLETYLNQQWGNIKDKKSDQESLSLREKVQSFLNQTSDVDGVHFLGYNRIYIRINYFFSIHVIVIHKSELND